MKFASLLCALSLSACTGWQLGGEVPKASVQASTPYQASPDVLASIDAAIASPPGRVPPSPPPVVTESQPIAFPPAPEPTPTPLPRYRPAPRPEPVTLPTTLIKEAQRTAQVEPQRRGYHGGSATQRWQYQPGKLYVVYVSPGQMTKIALPVGELLASKVFLDPEDWDVKTYRVGHETAMQDVVFVRPLIDEAGKVSAKDVDVALLTEQGHSFDVHLKVGTVGMFAVTWENPSVPLLLQDADQPRGQ